MSALPRTPLRQFLIVAASVAILAVVAASAFGQASPTSDRPSAAGDAPEVARGIATTVGGATIASGTAAYSMCCLDGSIPGITATGQADVHGQGSTARDAAIVRAVADATDQAKTAAGAAGITLGAILDLQISTPPFAYPLAGGTSLGRSAPSPTVVPAPYATFVSVTITWAIG